MKRITLCSLGFIMLVALACAQPFTYQGMLKDSGSPANGAFSMTFRLYNAATGGTPLGTVGPLNVAVSNGLFSVELNFPASVWDGGTRYLEIQVGSTTLSPRVKITPTPYASALRLFESGGGNPDRMVIAHSPTSTNWGLQYRDSDDSFHFVRAGVSKLRIGLDDGNVNTNWGFFGIRTDNLNRPLTIRGHGTHSEWIQFRDTVAGADKWHLNNLGNGLNFAETGVADARLFLAAGGNVGIGTSSPTERLHVNGNIRVADDASIFGLDRLVGFNDLRLAGDNNPPGGWDLYIAPDGRIGHRFIYGNSNFTIRNTGHTYAFVVEKADGTTLLAVQDDGRLAAAGLRNIGDFRNMQWNQSTGEIGWDTSSHRYKENITPLEDDFARVLSLQPKTYTRIGGDPNRWEIGYLAEEVHDLGLHRLVEYDLQGRPDGVNYEKMVLYLNEVIKQQQARIAALEQRVSELEARKPSQR